LDQLQHKLLTLLHPSPPGWPTGHALPERSLLNHVRMALAQCVAAPVAEPVHGQRRYLLWRLRRAEFLGETSSNLLAATTITGEAVRRSTNVDYRLDTVDAMQLLGHFGGPTLIDLYKAM
jgi:hypothetical protein